MVFSQRPVKTERLFREPSDNLTGFPTAATAGETHGRAALRSRGTLVPKVISQYNDAF